MYNVCVCLYICMHKIQTRGRSNESMEFPGILKKYHVEIWGVNWKRSAVSRVVQRVQRTLQSFQE